MRIFARDKAKNWIEGRIHSVLKNKKISIITILILLSGCFFYNQLISIFPQCYADDYKFEGKLLNDTKTISNNRQNELPKMILSSNNILDVKSPEELKKDEVRSQIYQMVGNAPIKDMVPSIVKLDEKVAAFVIGIAKKESDWGKHSPSKSGKTCYNYWGYKSSGSRGSSMGYACFGSPEEAVKTVGGRIAVLVDKKLDNPSKFVVWKCGGDCRSDKNAGDWISDVNLYFGKVMKIQNS